jgi:hypothetical protein
MGREARTDYVSGRECAQVKAHLDTMALQLSGGKKLTVPFSSIRTVVADGDELKIVAADARFSLKLGAKEAALWAQKIKNPPTLAHKLGIKDGVAVMLAGERVKEIDDAVAKAGSVTRTASTAASKAKLAGADIAVLTLAPPTAAKEIAAVAKSLGARTALWLVYRKGTKPNGDDIIGLARAAGLKDTKVARVSDTHAALRFIRAKA